ncbi:MAG: polysaccharide pyruvyl transferase family protein [Firmicutes bacterium]|nr:polysaccharide pyruvyl transferase family protein [Bacillota bacterium]
MAKVCISGYYGYDRVENELMLMSMVNALRRQDENMEIVVFSANIARTEADHDVVALGRDNWDAIRKELRSADLLIVGGGHLLQETADLADIKYYLKLMKMAQHMNVEVFFYHQILEPFANNRTKTMVARVLQKVRKITVADRNSVEVLHEMGIRRGRIHVMADPVLALKDVEAVWSVADADDMDKKAPAKAEAAAAEEAKKAEPINYDGMDVEIEIRIVEKEEPAVDPDKTIVITDLAETDMEEASVEEAPVVAEEEEVKPAKPVTNRPENLATMIPSFWKKPGEKFAAFVVAPKTELPVTQITAMADHMVDNGYQVVFLPLGEEDVALSREIMGLMQHPAYIVDGKISAASLYTAINAVDFVFSTELYPMMLAAICKKPFTALCCCERSLDFVSSLGLTPTGNLMDYNHEAFVYNFKAAVADPAAILAALEENLPAVQEKAAYGEEQLAMLFEQIERKKARGSKPRVARNAAPVVAEESPAEELPAEEGEEEAPAEEDVVAEETEAVEVEAEETVEELAEEFVEEDDAEDAGYVRRSRKAKSNSLDSVKDKAKDILGGISGKLKSLKGAKPARSSRRPVEDDEYLDDELALEEFTEDAEEKEVR